MKQRSNREDSKGETLPDPENQSDPSEQSIRKKTNLRVRWDEDNLEKNAQEAEELQPTPIEEPDTPWTSPPRELDDDVAPPTQPSNALAHAARALGALDPESSGDTQTATKTHSYEPPSDELQQRLHHARQRANDHRATGTPAAQPSKHSSAE